MLELKKALKPIDAATSSTWSTLPMLRGVSTVIVTTGTPRARSRSSEAMTLS
ncbi:MAG: hypothetical protein R3A52_32300 [Polyangiales bacterium]